MGGRTLIGLQTLDSRFQIGSGYPQLYKKSQSEDVQSQLCNRTKQRIVYNL